MDIADKTAWRSDMTERVGIDGLQIARALHDFVVDEAIPGTGVDPARFWQEFSAIVHDLAPRNRSLLARRDELQAKIDAWHNEHGAPSDLAAYRRFLSEIGYLLPEGPDFAVTTENVDPEIAVVAGPQLVVPVMNARYALNAANARWGSLYDALYGTDAIPETDGAEKGGAYNPKRGDKVIAWAREFLDQSAPLEGASWKDAEGLSVADGTLRVKMASGEKGLADTEQFAGYTGERSAPSTVLLKRHGLHVGIVVDRSHPIGKTDKAHIADVVLEAAMTTIQDCEDSIAAVDAEDKVVAYRNWLGLMKGDLVESFDKSGKTVTRRLNADREYLAPDGSKFSLPGRSLMLVRNVGHLMTNPAILDRDGREARKASWTP
jgi:malate synthase